MQKQGKTEKKQKRGIRPYAYVRSLLMLTMKKKLRLRMYPYAYVRTAVMRSMLFKKGDYDKMMKMDFNEIAKFLQDTAYREEINDLATKYSGPDLLELALNRSLAYSFKKLMRISSKQLGRVISEYAKRKDIEDIKTIIRGKFTNADEKTIEASLTGAGTLSMDFLISLAEKANIEDVLKSNGLVGYSLLSQALKEMEEKNTLAAIENALDKWYYLKLLEFSELLSRGGALFRSLLLMEIEVVDLLTLFRLKRMGYKKEDIINFLINPDEKTAKLADAENIEELARLLSATRYREAVEKGMHEFREKNSLISLESELYRQLLKQATLFLHQHPLSVNIIIGYMLAKDIEVRNLKLVIKAKQFGLNNEFIEKQMVY